MLDQSHRLYIALVNQARQPNFYARLEVPDTLDGRFDMILLHLYMVTSRLKADETSECHVMAQQLADIFFNDMDRSLREIGVGDMSVGKKVKKMADAYHGRLTVYAEVLESPQKLTDALRRNVYGTAEPQQGSVEALAAYVSLARQSLAQQPAASLMDANLHWPEIA